MGCVSLRIRRQLLKVDWMASLSAEHSPESKCSESPQGEEQEGREQAPEVLLNLERSLSSLYLLLNILATTVADLIEDIEFLQLSKIG